MQLLLMHKKQNNLSPGIIFAQNIQNFLLLDRSSDLRLACQENINSLELHLAACKTPMMKLLVRQHDSVFLLKHIKIVSVFRT